MAEAQTTEYEDSLFGEIIYSYTRADQLADGEMIDVTETAREAGFRAPMALSRAVWEDCVAWTDEDARRKPRVCQDESGRLWDVVFVAGVYARALRQSHEVTYTIKRIPRPGFGRRQVVQLKLVLGAGDPQGNPVFTIMFPEED